MMAKMRAAIAKVGRTRQSIFTCMLVIVFYLTILKVIAVLRDGKMVLVFATVPMMMKVELLLLK